MANVEIKHETALDATAARSRLARVYAEALIAAARAEAPETAAAVGAELTDLARAVGENPTVGTLLTSPVIGKKARAAALATALEGRASRPVRGLLTVLARHNRLGQLRGIAAAYRALLDEEAGRVRVLVTAAAPLADDQAAKLAANLKTLLKQEPVLDLRIDPELLGGLVIQVGDSVVDTSVRTRLQSLRTLLLDKGGYGN